MSRNGGKDGGSVLRVRIARPVDRPAPADTRASVCRFCPSALTSAESQPLPVRSPAQLVLLARDAWEDGLARMWLTAEVPDDVPHYVRAVRDDVPGMRVAVDCGPADACVLHQLRTAGVTDVGIHIGSLDDDVRARDSDAEAVPLSGYERAWDEAVRVFGRYRVTTCLVVGAGENPGDLVSGAARLIARGVQPVVVPYRAGTDALVRWAGQAVADMLRTVGAGNSSGAGSSSTATGPHPIIT
ncbi:radical SAM protein [Cryptosporangium phraense]|uniref:Radical SAM protein n=1 Tax=Cryptosporangium phraense TaxID=2593070 RepID=A0A545AY85_9ACTN|nr:radical SAM protein [Cryptosporangium phraense]TQS46307.1 hypothetical protein FL583_02620 [Cryptosporangium phraense]